MSAKVFFDTNVLVYAFDNNEPEKAETAQKLIDEFGSIGKLVLSTQVLQELYVTLTRTGKLSIEKSKAKLIVDSFSEFELIQVDKNIISMAMKRNQSKDFSFWDSLIVEAALSSDCNTLYTEDMHDGLEVDSLVLRNPFTTKTSMIMDRE